MRTPEAVVDAPATGIASPTEPIEEMAPPAAKKKLAAFFDKGGVMVMDPDAKLRDNRLALLQGLLRPYLEIADFRKLGGSA